MEIVVAGASASDVAGLVVVVVEPVEWLEELELGAAWLALQDCMRSRGRLETLLSFHGGQPAVWTQMWYGTSSSRTSSGISVTETRVWSMVYTIIHLTFLAVAELTLFFLSSFASEKTHAFSNALNALTKEHSNSSDF